MKLEMIGLIFIVALLAFCLGCLYERWAPFSSNRGINMAYKPDQDIAIRIVWYETFKAPCPPPTIMWVEKPDLNCDNGRSFVNPFSNRSGKEISCVHGLFWPYMTMIAWPKGAKFSTTAFVHELTHAYLYVTKGIVDSEHKDDIWKPGSIMFKAIENLKRFGL